MRRPAHNDFSIIHQNLQCIKNKIEDLEIFLADEKPDVMCISESWCSDSEMNCINVLDYKICNYYNRSQFSHGGVLILAKKMLEVKKITEIDILNTEKLFEATGVKSHKRGHDFCILCIYRSPNNDVNMFLNKFDECLNIIFDKYPFSKVICCGDFNINFLGDSKEKTDLIDLASSFYLSTATNEATRITRNSETAIDYIFTNFKDRLSDKKIIHNGLSDHSAQKITFPIVNDEYSETYKSRSFSKKNIKQFIDYLKTEQWYDVRNNNLDVDSKFENFINVLDYYYNLSFKLVTKNKSNYYTNKNWITNGIKTSSRNLKDLNIQQKQGFIDITFYKKYKLIYRRVIREAKKMYYDNKIINSENKSKMVWNIINSTIKNQSSCKQYSISLNDTDITDKNQIANIFNNHFVNLPQQISNSKATVNVPITTPHVEQTIFLEPVDESEVINVINNLKNSTSSGADNYSTSLIKKISVYLAKPLCHIINLCFKDGSFPNILKISKIICLYKKGNPKSITNYRPISLLSVFSKIIEKILAKRIISFLEENNILSNSQHGFREKRSTMSALYSILDFIYKQLDKNNKVMAVFVDLTKAFDCVDHEILVRKLEAYGLRGNCNNLLKNYLCNRKQFVHFLGENSIELPIEFGVPQGSVLGPLLFLLYCNDVSSFLNIFHCEFADDMTLLASDRNIDNVIQHLTANLRSLLQYFSSINLNMNQEKTFSLQFHPQASNYTSSALIRINGKSIQQVKSFKLLGLYLDLSLNWKDHITYICNKTAKQCFALKRLNQITSKRVSKIFYHSSFESVIRYGIICWGNASEAKRVFILQKRAIRCMFGLKFRETCKPVFINEKILTIPCLFILESLKFVKNNISSFNFQNIYHEYNTRHGHNLQYDMHRIELYKSNPYYISAVLYNKLPDRIKLCSYKKFLKNVKVILLTNAFYSVNEYMMYNLV